MAKIIEIKYNVETGEITKAEKELKDLEKQTKKAGGESKKTAGALGGLGKVLGALATVAAAKELADFAVAATRAAREVRILSDIAGIGVEEFQRQAYAARQVGIEQDKLADIYRDVNDKLGDFIQTGQGPLKDFFDGVGKQVGVTIEDFRNLSGPQALGLYVDTLEKAGANQQEMAFFMESLASDASQLVPLMRDNAKLMGEFGDEAGEVLTQETIDKADELNKMFDTMSNTIGNKLKNGIIGATFALAEFFNLTESTAAEKRLEEIEKRAQFLREELEGGGRGGFGAVGPGQFSFGDSPGQPLTGTLSEEERIEKAMELLDLEKERVELQTKLNKLTGEHIEEIEVTVKQRAATVKDAEALAKAQEKAARAAEKEAENARRKAEALADEIESWRKVGDPVRQYREQLLRINELMVIAKEDPQTLADLEQAWLRVAEAAGKVGEKEDKDKAKTFIEELTDEITSLETAMKQAKTDGIVQMSDAIADMVVSGKADFRSLASAILADIAKMIVKMLILRAVSSFLSPAGAADNGGTVTRDSGGPGNVGQATLIGTGAQPELFVPHSTGTFYPKHQLAQMMGGGGGVNVGSINVTLQEREGETSEEQAARISKQIRSEMRGLVVNELGNQSRKGNMLNPSPIQAFR